MIRRVPIAVRLALAFAALALVTACLPLQAQVRSGTSIVAQGTAPLAVRVPPSPTTVNVVVHGDSITKDQGRFNYSVVLASTITSGQGAVVALTARGINGISYDYRWPSEPYNATLITDATGQIDPLQTAGIPNWLIVFAGTNGMNASLGNHSAATEYANFKTYIAARIAAGWTSNRIVVVTMLPRVGFTDATRQAFNASLVGDDGGYGYRLARVDQNSTIGDAADAADTNYYYDGTHPTVAGQAIIADVIYHAMFG